MRELIKEILEKVPEDNRDSFEVKLVLEYSDLAEVPARLNGKSNYRYVVTGDKLNFVHSFMGEDDSVLVSFDNEVYSLEKTPSGEVTLAGSYPIKTI